MSKLKDVKTVTAVAEISRFGDQLVIPQGMDIDGAIDLLKRRREYEQKDMMMSEVFDAFPWDGAFALNTVLERKYGWAQAVATPGLFGSEPPVLINIEVGPNETKMVPWGAFTIPGIVGRLQTGVQMKDGRMMMQINANVRRLYEPAIRELFNEVRRELKRNSIYRGQAIKIRFRDDDGDPLPLPSLKFIDTSVINESLVVYPQLVHDAINTNLFTPITRAQDCIDNGIPLKRGILLGGTYGTGKTLAATVASKLAVNSGVTYVYVPRADELPDAINFARQYQSPACVIFCEDIDRVVSGDRTVAMDDILNVIDGIDAKSCNIIVVLTTNDLSAINPAMLRPGRLDAVIEVTAPDAKAVEKLIRLYAGNALPESVDLTDAGKLLAGCIPAIIAEVVKRAKLSQLSIQEAGTTVKSLTQAAIVQAAATMQSQVELLKRCMEPAPKPESLDSAMARTIRSSLNGQVDHHVN